MPSLWQTHSRTHSLKAISMFISIRQARPRPSPVLATDQDEIRPTSTMSTRERMMKRSSMGWSKKTKAMEGFAFTIKAQIAGKEDLPITSQWRTVVASPYESPKKYSSDAGQPE
jgi:hypothetical protein